MFDGIDMKKWKKEFYFNNTRNVMLRIKYSHKWYFPAMLASMIILILGFVLFVIGFFLLEPKIETAILYTLLVFLFMIIWGCVYVLIQHRATFPYKNKKRGFLVFTEEGLCIKNIGTNTSIDYQYEDIKKIIVNKKTLAIAIIDNKQNTIFNEVVKSENISEILKILYETTKIKPILS